MEVRIDMRMSDLFLALQEAEDVRTITIHPWVVKLLGGIKETVFFTNICQWVPGTNRTKEIYKTMEEIENETGLTVKEQLTARKNLVSLGVIRERHARLEHRLYFALDLAGIDRIIENGEMTERQSPKTRTVIPRKSQSEVRERHKGRFVKRNKRITRELQENIQIKNHEAANGLIAAKAAKKKSELDPRIKTLTDRIFESDPNKFRDLIKWVKQGQKYNYTDEVIAKTLTDCERYIKRPDMNNWWGYLDSVILKVEAKLNLSAERSGDAEQDYQRGLVDLYAETKND